MQRKRMKLLSQPASSGSNLLLSSLDYRLYRLGWNHRLHSPPHPILWIVMSLSYLYRRGFKEASRWAATQHSQRAEKRD
ncbi:hypothetical protein GKIL_2016 [Gloeobacter kilaueensis JS1]|uniref:Uncharacterized protein n=1 Tax=Gloeobacter kilaueensis (strain ATCC BAA-2537 / CCAP 1431/1 / ULC 316 / JS1) TaxID=1183438 RepID=U5QH12_GLOK1|nr:hypothetical protein GKIL_2016 [Gloeobacter kilaueensis JS1]